MSALTSMVNGLDYPINDEELIEIRYQTRDKVDEFNALGARQVAEKDSLIRKIFGQVGHNVHFEKGMRIDYGINTTFGDNVFINFNLSCSIARRCVLGITFLSGQMCKFIPLNIRWIVIYAGNISGARNRSQSVMMSGLAEGASFCQASPSEREVQLVLAA